MTNKFKKIKLLLALGLAGFTAGAVIPSVALKASAEGETYRYVSLGDSMTTGFGYDDYYVDNDPLAKTKGVDYKIENLTHHNVRGFLVQASEAYPALITKALEGTYGKGNVEWTPLAANAARIDDLYYNISGDKNTDDFYAHVIDADTDYESWNTIWGNRAKAYGWTENNGNEGVVETYQAAIREADLVTLNAGFNNFGCFITGKLGQFIESDQFDVSKIFGTFGGNDTLRGFIERHELDIDLDKLYEELYKIVKELFDIDLKEYEDYELFPGTTIHVKKLVETVVLAFVSYCWYMNECTKAILELNPDVELVVLGLYNNQKGLVFSYEDTTIDISGGLVKLYDLANTYTTVCCEKADDFKYVILSNVEVENHFDLMKGEYAKLDESEKNRFGEGVADFVNPVLKSNPATSAYSVVGAQVRYTYETDYGDIVDSGRPDWQLLYQIKPYVMKIYPALQRASGLEVLSVENLLAGIKIYASGGDIISALQSGKLDELMNLNIRMLMNNGIWSHPSAAGHVAIANAALRVINNPLAPSARQIGFAKLEAKLQELWAKYGDRVIQKAKEVVLPYIEAAKAKLDETFSAYYQQLQAYIAQATGNVKAGLERLGQQFVAVYSSINNLHENIKAIFNMTAAQIAENYQLILQQLTNSLKELGDQLLNTKDLAAELLVLLEKEGTPEQKQFVETVYIYLNSLYAEVMAIHDFIVFGILLQDVSYEWAPDYSACVAHLSFLGDFKADEIGVVTSEVIVKPTLYENGTTRYTATFEHVEPAVAEVDDIPMLYIVSTSYDWAEDGSACEADMLLSNGEHLVQDAISIVPEVTIKPTLDSKGEKTFTASFEDAEDDVLVIELPALTIVNTEYDWSEDGKSCTAKLTLSDGSKLDEVGTVTSEVEIKPTLDVKGTTKYTASFEHAASNSKSIQDIPVLEIVDTEYVWEEDGSACKAIMTLDDGTVVEEKGTITSLIAIYPTLDYKGVTFYIATFEHAEIDTIAIDDIPALTIKTTNYVWSLDGKICVADLILSDDSVYRELGTIVSEVTTKPTLDKKGFTTYTATFAHAASTSKDIEDVDKLTIKEKSYEWADDGSTCVAHLVLSDGSLLDEVGTITSKEALHPTLDAKGKTEYTATFAHAETATKVIEDIPELTIKSCEYVWEDDGSACVAKLVLSDDSKLNEDAVVNSQVYLKPTLDSKGKTEYIAVFEHAESDSKIIEDIDALTIKSFTYDWADDGSTCVAKLVLSDDSKLDEEGVIKSEEFLHPTLDTKGKTKYTAVFEHAQSDSKIIEDIDVLTIKSCEYVWEDDGSACVAKLVLSDDSKLNEDAVVNSQVYLKPTLDSKGKTEYIAVFEHAESDSKIIEDIDALTIKSEEYDWEDDGSACVATLTLSDDSLYYEFAEIKSEVVLEPTWSTKGKTKYTATFEHAKTQELTLEDIEPLQIVDTEYFWEPDGSACRAESLLSDGSILKEQGKISSKIGFEPTLDDYGVTVYVAEFEKAHVDSLPVEDIAKLTIKSFTYEWADNGSACVAHLVLSNDSKLDEVGLIVSSVVAKPTLDVMGTTKYVATFAHAQTTDKSIQDIAKLTISKTVYDWADDGSSCSAHLVLSDDSPLDEVAEISSKEALHPTLDAKGKTEYTATFAHAQASSKVIENLDKLTIKSTSHEWTENGSACVAHLVLSDDSNLDEIGIITSAVKTPSTLDVKGVTTYTAYFTHAEGSSKDIQDIALLTIKSADYVWAEDGSSCVAHLVLSDDSKLDEQATISSNVAIKPTLDEKGTTLYKATFAHAAGDNFAVVDIPQLTIKSTVYTWLDNGSACVATLTLSDDSELYEVGIVTHWVSVKPTLDEKGTTLYKATFAHAEDSEKAIQDIAKLIIVSSEFVWALDGSACVASLVLSDDSRVTENATITSVVSKPATIEAWGETTYTAKFAHAAEQTMTLVNIEKIRQETKEDGSIKTADDTLAEKGVETTVKEGTKELVIEGQEIAVKFNEAATNSIKGKGATLKVEVNEEPSQEQAVIAVEVSLLDAQGAKVNFDGSVTVSVAYDAKVTEGKVVVVYFVNGDKLEKVDSKLENGVLSFTTTHFSTYIAVEESPAFPGWAIALIVIGAVVVAGAIVLVVVKKRKAAK